MGDECSSSCSVSRHLPELPEFPDETSVLAEVYRPHTLNFSNTDDATKSLFAHTPVQYSGHHLFDNNVDLVI